MNIIIAHEGTHREIAKCQQPVDLAAQSHNQKVPDRNGVFLIDIRDKALISRYKFSPQALLAV